MLRVFKIGKIGTVDPVLVAHSHGRKIQLTISRLIFVLVGTKTYCLLAHCCGGCCCGVNVQHPVVEGVGCPDMKSLNLFWILGT